MSLMDNYAGDLVPSQAFDLLRSDPNAVLVDCRTAPEWQYVGLPDLSDLEREVILLSWQVYPEMAVQSDFAAKLAQAGVDSSQPVLLLCRSGVRSRAAAIALTQAGFKKAYNVAEGFEGDIDESGHRGAKGGWKYRGLPWRQK